jgi:glycosyltransferase involved in cell wall biosynthesis
VKGWLVNDQLTGIPGTRTLWHDLLEWFDLEDCTGVSYAGLAEAIEQRPGRPDFIIRNAMGFRPTRRDVPTIALVQDVLEDHRRVTLLESALSAQVVVFNSEYTKACYPELAQQTHRVIPLSIDYSLFRPSGEPYPGIPPGSVCFIGDQSLLKGYDWLWTYVIKQHFPVTMILKDHTPNVGNWPVRSFVRLTHSELVSVVSACSVGVCLSRQETQHLAGLEMGACGLPLVTTNVGIYYNRHPGVWGTTASPEQFPDAIRSLLGQLPPSNDVRHYWLDQGHFTPEACRASWAEAIVACQTPQ